MVLNTIMDGIAAYAVAQGVTSKAYGWPVPDPQPPCLIVEYPRITFDMTFKRGADEMTFPLWFVCGRSNDKAARDVLSGIITGATGIKDKLDGAQGGTYLQTARVVDCAISAYTIGGVD